MRSKFEIRCQQELEAEGYLIDWKIRPSGFKNPRGYAVDYFGLFDILAYSAPIIRFIAIKGQAGVPSSLRKAIEAFELPNQCIKEIWSYHKKKGRFVCRKEVL